MVISSAEFATVCCFFFCWFLNFFCARRANVVVSNAIWKLLEIVENLAVDGGITLSTGCGSLELLLPSAMRFLDLLRDTFGCTAVATIPPVRNRLVCLLEDCCRPFPVPGAAAAAALLLSLLRCVVADAAVAVSFPLERFLIICVVSATFESGILLKEIYFLLAFYSISLNLCLLLLTFSF